MSEHWLKQPKMLLSAKLWRCSNHQKTPTKKASLTGIGKSLVQIKCTDPCLTAFIIAEHWLKQPKMLPSHIVVECQSMKMYQPPQKSCQYKPSLTGVEMSLDQIKHTYLCLTAFIITEHWLKQPKILCSKIVVECQTMKVLQPPLNSCIKTFPDRY